MRGTASTRWLALGLSLSRIAPIDEAAVTRASTWLPAVLTEVGAVPPPGIVLDVGRLLEGHPVDCSHGATIEHPALRAAVGAYEDRVLGRLAAGRRLQAVRDAYAALEPRLEPVAVSVVVASLFRGCSLLEPVEAGILRKLSRRPAAEVVALGFDVWRDPGELFDRLAEGYAELVEAVRARRALLSDADVFTLENLSVLSEMGPRVAIAQIVSAAEALERRWPTRVKVRRRRDGPAPTALEDESAFPAGGFTSVATHGALENLVTSELVYMDSAQERSKAEGQRVDLFDIRYAEGELLYYTRDEALIVRPRRVIVFVLHRSLALATIKDPGMPWQRGVVLLGCMLAMIRCLERWLGASELSFRCIVEQVEGHVGALAHERALAELLLTEWRDKGMASLETLDRETWQARASAEAQRADVRVIVLGDAADVDGDDRVPVVHLSAAERDWDAWCADGLAVLRELI